MREIFYHDQKGTDAFTGNLKVRKFLGTMTLHPIKVPTLLYRLHNFFLVSPATNMSNCICSRMILVGQVLTLDEVTK